MLVLQVLDKPKSTTSHTLGGKRYRLTTKLNSRDNRWSLTIENGEGEILLSGARLMENQGLLQRYYIEGFSHGNLVVVRTGVDNKDVGRYNLGIDKPYALVYVSNSEIDALQ